MEKIDERVLLSAIETFGAEKQIDHMIEEAGELIVAIMELKRNEGKHPGRVSVLIDQIADVYVMIHQMVLMFDKEAVHQRIDEKMQRLSQRISNYNEKNKIEIVNP